MFRDRGLGKEVEENGPGPPQNPPHGNPNSDFPQKESPTSRISKADSVLKQDGADHATPPPLETSAGIDESILSPPWY